MEEARQTYREALKQTTETHHRILGVAPDLKKGHQTRIRFIKQGLKEIGITKDHFQGKQVLDIGSGTGPYADIANEYGASNVVMTDVEPTRKDVIQIDGSSLPFKDGQFDVITLGRVFSMAHNPLALTQEVRRVLKPVVHSHH